MTRRGELIASGFNEVPAPEGGPYFAADAYASGWDPRTQPKPTRDGELEYSDPLTGETIYGVDPNDRIKLEIVRDLVDQILLLPNVKVTPTAEDGGDGHIGEAELFQSLLHSAEFGDSKVLEVIEYGRTVHAEMHALLQCARLGIPTRGCVLYTTTFPCHECARHIVASGINRVVFLEPYPKSKVSDLHSDSIKVRQFTGPGDANGRGTRPSTQVQVELQPYVGISPRRQRALYGWVSRKEPFQPDFPENAGKKVAWAPSAKATLREDAADAAFRGLQTYSRRAHERYAEVALQNWMGPREDSPPETPS